MNLYKIIGYLARHRAEALGSLIPRPPAWPESASRVPSGCGASYERAREGVGRVGGITFGDIGIRSPPMRHY